MKYLYIFCGLMLLAFPAMAENDQDLSRQLELLNAVTKSQLQLENQKLESRIESHINELETQNASILTRLDQRDGDIGNYIDAISWVSGIVIGFVGILFGIGAFILYRENKDVTTKAQAQLDAWDEQAANLQSRFDQWFKDAKGVYAGELEQLGRIMRLRILLDQEKPSTDDIYPDLSPLYSNPQLEYLPIFKKVMALDVDNDIKRHTQAAIDQIIANPRGQSR
ncbi:MAG: hypothetical protein ABGY96_09710 [bacterium]|nr:hypothetical protein [Gammaproteobacteria bacterium]HIL97932.1 hypothetical protein [Pseudomonadales bacterium]